MRQWRKPLFTADLSQHAGPNTEPPVTEGNVVNGQSIDLNSRSLGVLSEGETDQLIFNPNRYSLVLVILEGDFEHIDAVVESSYYHGQAIVDDGMKAIMIFNAWEDTTYAIKIKAWAGNGHYKLTMVEANRRTLGLTDSEYLFKSYDYRLDECAGEENKDLYSINYFVVNPYESYLNTPYRERFDLQYRGDYTFDYRNTNIKDQFRSHVTAIYTLDPIQGALTGRRYIDYEEDGKYPMTCKISIEIDAEIIL